MRSNLTRRECLETAENKPQSFERKKEKVLAARKAFQDRKDKDKARFRDYILAQRAKQQQTAS